MSPAGFSFSVMLPGEHDERDSGERKNETGVETQIGPLPAQVETGEQGREERSDRDQHTDVRGERIGQRDVFEQKIERYAGQPRAGVEPLLLPAPERQFAADQMQGRKTEQKAQEQDFDRRKLPQQHFGGDEGGSPDQDRGQRRQMGSGFGFQFQHDALR